MTGAKKTSATPPVDVHPHRMYSAPCEAGRSNDTLHGRFPSALIHIALLTQFGWRCRWVGNGSSLGGGGRGTALTGSAQDDDGDGVQVHELKHLAGRLVGTAPASPAAAAARPCSGATPCTRHTQPQPQSCCQTQLRLDGELLEPAEDALTSSLAQSSTCVWAADDDDDGAPIRV